MKNKDNEKIEFLMRVYLSEEMENMKERFKKHLEFKYVFIPLHYYERKKENETLDRGLVYFPSGKGWIDFLKNTEKQILEFCRNASGKRLLLDREPLEFNVEGEKAPIGLRPIRPFYVPLEKINPDLKRYFE